MLLDSRAFDADNHYDEAVDAFTRHVPRAKQKRAIQGIEGCFLFPTSGVASEIRLVMRENALALSKP